MTSDWPPAPGDETLFSHLGRRGGGRGPTIRPMELLVADGAEQSASESLLADANEVALAAMGPAPSPRWSPPWRLSRSRSVPPPPESVFRRWGLGFVGAALRPRHGSSGEFGCSPRAVASSWTLVPPCS